MPGPAMERASNVAVYAPTGRDGQLAAQVFGRWEIGATSYDSMPTLCAALGDGRVGMMVIAEEALLPAARDQLLGALDAQPAWSDVPVVVLTAEGELSRAITSGVGEVARRANVTLLERPVRVATLVTVVRSALRARQRQYDVRDTLVALQAAQGEAEEARVAAEQANRAKSEFLAVMSHELRTPLNAIGGYAELIEMEIHGPVTAAQRDALRRVQQSERHLLGLINGVLNYARLETGSIHYDIVEVPVAESLATAQALVAPQAESHGLTLELLPCDPSLTVRADRDKLQQILLNLLTNAIKFTPSGGRIRVGCDAGETDVLMHVADTGRGIPASKMAAIFEPFVQVDTQLTRTDGGVGLGLAISRDLARRMGGDLEVKSELGAGSTFTLCLPRAG